jgi:hypothetical protein
MSILAGCSVVRLDDHILPKPGVLDRRYTELLDPWLEQDVVLRVEQRHDNRLFDQDSIGLLIDTHALGLVRSLPRPFEQLFLHFVPPFRRVEPHAHAEEVIGVGIIGRPAAKRDLRPAPRNLLEDRPHPNKLQC